MAVQFHDAHEALKTLVGNEFDKINIEYQNVIVKRMQMKNVSIMESVIQLLEIANDVVKDEGDKTVATMQLLAATVELLENKKKDRAEESGGEHRPTAVA